MSAPHRPPRLPQLPLEREPARLTRAVVTRDEQIKNGVLAGAVLSWTTGQPIAGAELGFARSGVLHSVSSDAQGRFGFVPTTVGRYTLAVVTAAGYFPYAPELGQSPIVFEARPQFRVSDMTVFLQPAVEYTGVVLSPDGKAVVGAQVKLFNATTQEQSLLGLVDHFVSDHNGEFRFSAHQRSLFEATHPKFSPGRAEVDREVVQSGRMTLTLRPAGISPVARLEIAGKVVDEHGDPIAGAFVDAQPKGASGLTTAPSTTSAPDGVFVLTDLDPGTYQVAAVHAELSPTIVEAQAGARDLVLKLVIGLQITGHIISANSQQPIPAASIAILQHRGLLRDVVKTVSVLDALGTYRIAGVLPGNYSLIASAYGYAPSPEHVLDVTVDVSEDIALSQGGSLSGTVIDRVTHKPVGNARVALAADNLPDGSSPLPFVGSATTDDTGAFIFTGLPIGRESLEVVALDHHTRTIGGIEVVGDETLPPMTIALTPTKPGEVPRGEVAGIGCAVAADKETLIITAVLPGSGAEEVKLQEGDSILQVEGTAVSELGMNGAIQKLRGMEGTTVQLTVRHKAGGAVTTVIAPRIVVKF